MRILLSLKNTIKASKRLKKSKEAKKEFFTKIKIYGGIGALGAIANHAEPGNHSPKEDGDNLTTTLVGAFDELPLDNAIN